MRVLLSRNFTFPPFFFLNNCTDASLSSLTYNLSPSDQVQTFIFTCMNLADIVTRDLDLFFLPFSLKHQTLIPSSGSILMLFLAYNIFSHHKQEVGLFASVQFISQYLSLENLISRVAMPHLLGCIHCFPR